ncbi:MAG: hypothetical protein H0V44_08015 [Planctomycetes bacterium]|nr:hypothetical protein [Planctomycetota bacterium]
MKPILYLGDSSLSGAAGYLAGLMTSFGFGYDHVPSDVAVDVAAVGGRRLVVLSDYPAKLLAAPAQARLAAEVRAGTGLLMIGGWESFCGLGGDWAASAVAEALPVAISATDDRINCDQPALALRVADHATVQGLPWDLRPPTIGGFNRVTTKPGATTVLEVQRFSARQLDGGFEFQPSDLHPLLVVGAHGKGRTAALTTDLAPHWVGGFVDWGDSRVTATAPGSWTIEVGSDYARFVRSLLTWTGKLG